MYNHIWNISIYMCKYEMIFSKKKHVKFGRMIKRDLFKVCSIVSYIVIFPIFRAICGYHTSKNLPLLSRTIHRAIFSHLRTNQSVAQQVRDPSTQTSGNRKESSLVSKPHGVELPSWVLPTCPELVLPYVMEHCHGEKWPCVASFGRFFKQRTVQSINCCW